MKNIKWAIFVPSVALIAAALLAVAFNLDTVQATVSSFYDVVAGGFSWVFILSDLAAVGFAAWCIFGPHAKIRMGGQDAKADYSLFAWAAIMFTTSCSAGLILFGFIEPLYYASEPPFEIVPFTKTAWETAEMYAHFHWGINVWAIYVPAAIVISLLIYNFGKKKVSLGDACLPAIGKSGEGPLGTLIDIVSTFGATVAPVTSMGLGLPLVILLVIDIFGLAPDMNFTVEIIIMAAWVLAFIVCVYLGLDKGIKNLSNLNVVLAFGFMACVLVLTGVLPSVKAEINSLGLYVSNIFRMSTYTDPYGTGEFVSSWTIWYFAWITVYMPLMGVLTAKVSKGRTVREIAVGLTVVCSLGCFVAIMTLGNYSVGLQQSGALDAAAILSEQGQAAAIVAIVQTMPLPVIAEAILAILCMIFMVTTVNSSSLVAAELTSDHDAAQMEAPRGMRVIWAVIISLITIVLLAVGGFAAVQTLALLIGLPLCLVQVAVIVSGVKLLQGKGEE